jgi:signal transduction histidine kinase
MTTVTAEAPLAAQPVGNSYWRLWKQVPRELGFLVLTLPIATVGYIITVTLFSAAAGTVILVVPAVLLLLGTLYVSRGFGELELLRLQWAGRAAIERPIWPKSPTGTSVLRRLQSVFSDGHYWLYTLHTMIINFVLSTITWSIMVTWVATAFGGVTYWFWQVFLPNPDTPWFFSKSVNARLNLPTTGLDWVALDAIYYLVFGIIFMVTLPFVLRGMTALHEYAARATLGSFKSDALRREVRELAASRGDAISAEGHSLRRLERDIHDGPQQRLVRLQMDLAAAERQMESNPKKAQALISEAMQQSKDALEELRALSRGFAPPILADRGLVAALESAATRFSISAKVVNDLPADAVIPQEVERNAYFVAVEALTNAVKHSSASEVVTRVSLRGSARAKQHWLDVSITDNGTGGAIAIDGHGIAGLEQRLRGFGGTLDVSSPDGGPTVVTAHFPISPPASPAAAPAPGPAAGTAETPSA